MYSVTLRNPTELHLFNKIHFSFIGLLFLDVNMIWKIHQYKCSMVLYLAFLGKVFLEDTIMKYQRNIYFKYNTCTIEEHVHEISTIIMLIYVKFMKC